MRARVEAIFEAWGRLIVRRPRSVIVAVAALTAVAVFELAAMRLDNSVEGFLRRDDPTLVEYNAFRRQFGRDHWIVLAIGPADVFSTGFLARLDEFHAALSESAPHVHEITSLVNARWTHADGDTLVVEDLLERRPETAEELAALRERVLSNPIYAGSLVSRNASFTTVVVRPLVYSELSERSDSGEPAYITEVELERLAAAVRDVSSRFDAPDFPISVTGVPVISERANRYIERDVAVFFAAAHLLILGLLYLFFRRVGAAVLPVFVVSLSLLATFGVMSALDIALSATTQILPTLFLVIGVADGVHVVTAFYQALAAGESREAAVPRLLASTGPAVLLTSVITATGMLSFLTAEAEQVRHLGIVGPIGVVVAMLYSLSLLPALLAVFKLRGLEAETPLTRSLGARLGAIGAFSSRFAWPVTALGAAVIAAAAAGASGLTLAQDQLRWFPEDEPVRLATELINDELDGILTIELVVDTHERDGVLRPDVLRRIDGAVAAVRTLRDGDLRVTSALSIVDIVEEVNQALTGTRAIPETRELVAQELLLFEMSRHADLESLVDGEYRKARVSLRVPWVDSTVYPAFIDRVRREAEAAVGEVADVQVTGLTNILARTFRALVQSIAQSYALEMVVITPLMMLLLGSVWAGSVAMVPNVAPVVITLGVMGALDIPLDFATLLVGNIVISLVLDDTVHLVYHFRRECDRGVSAPDAIAGALEAIGPAICFTSAALALGFATFLLGHMLHIRWFGIIGVSAIAVAFVAELTLSPALLTLVARARRPSGTPLGEAFGDTIEPVRRAVNE